MIEGPMQRPNLPLFRREAPWMVMLLLGLAPWLVVPDLAQVREAWDSPWFMAVALPVITLGAAIGGWLSPTRAWLMAPAAITGQFVGLFAKAPPANPVFLIMGSITMFILHAPALGAALGAAAVRRRLDR